MALHTCSTSLLKSALSTTPRAAAMVISMRGPLANATGPVHGSSREVPLPVAEQLRHCFLRLVREAPAERPKPVDIRVRVRHEYHSKTPAKTSPLEPAAGERLCCRSSEACAMSMRGEMNTSSSARPIIGSSCVAAYLCSRHKVA